MQILFLKNQMDRSAGRYLFHTIRTIIRAEGDRDYVIDRVHGHIWFVSDTNEISDTCACGLYSAINRFQIEWKNWSFFVDNEKTEE